MTQEHQDLLNYITNFVNNNGSEVETLRNQLQQCGQDLSYYQNGGGNYVCPPCPDCPQCPEQGFTEAQVQERISQATYSISEDLNRLQQEVNAQNLSNANLSNTISVVAGERDAALAEIQELNLAIDVAQKQR